MSGAISLTINKIAHKAFGIQKDTYLSYAVKAIAFAAGVSVSVYFAPQASLVQFKGRAVIEMAVIEATITVALSIFTKLKASYKLTFANGAALGYFGPRSLIPCGAIGALTGAIA